MSRVRCVGSPSRTPKWSRAQEALDANRRVRSLCSPRWMPMRQLDVGWRRASRARASPQPSSRRRSGPTATCNKLSVSAENESRLGHVSPRTPPSAILVVGPDLRRDDGCGEARAVHLASHRRCARQHSRVLHESVGSRKWALPAPQEAATRCRLSEWNIELHLAAEMRVRLLAHSLQFG
jgi:hypothetical protein